MASDAAIPGIPLLSAEPETSKNLVELTDSSRKKAPGIARREYSDDSKGGKKTSIPTGGVFSASTAQHAFRDLIVGEKQDVFHCKQCCASLPPSKHKGWTRYKLTLHLVMEQPSFNALSRFISIVLLLLIIMSTTGLVLETIPELTTWPYWFTLEAIVSILFTIEYVLRFVAARSRLKFVISALNFVEILSVLPFYIEVAAHNSNLDITVLRVFRTVRLFRVFRMFHLDTASKPLFILIEALHQSTDSFGILFFFLGLTLTICGSMIYYAEQGVYDPATGLYLRSDGSESPFTSIPITMYFCLITMTTVGYGDMFPVEIVGKLLSGTMMIFGLLVLALPISILATNFTDIYYNNDDHERSRGDDDISVHGFLGEETIMIPYLREIKKCKENIQNIMKDLSGELAPFCSGESIDFMPIWANIEDATVGNIAEIEKYIYFLEKGRMRPPLIKDEDAINNHIRTSYARMTRKGSNNANDSEISTQDADGQKNNNQDQTNRNIDRESHAHVSDGTYLPEVSQSHNG